MTVTIAGTKGIAGSPTVTGAKVTLSPSVRGETDVQAALEAGVPVLLAEQAFFSTTTAPPGDVYATDTRLWDPGLYQIEGTTTVDASNNNTQVWVGFELDAALQPNPWIDTPVGGTLSISADAPIVLTGGSHTFAVRLAKASGTGSSQARSSILWVVKVGPLP